MVITASMLSVFESFSLLAAGTISTVSALSRVSPKVRGGCAPFIGRRSSSSFHCQVPQIAARSGSRSLSDTDNS